MLGFGMYYVVNNIYSQSVSRYIYYRQSKAYRRIVTGSHFLFIWRGVIMIAVDEPAADVRLVMAIIVIFFVAIVMLSVA